MLKNKFSIVKLAALVCLFVGVACILPAHAQQRVRGYFRSNGTYVQPYVRSTPNSTVRDNYNYYGNTNPYTGQSGTNRYQSNPSSGYYNGGYNSNNSNDSDYGSDD